MTREPVRYPAMRFTIETTRLSLRLRDADDAVWNHELLGEHDGGTTESVVEVRRRIAEQHTRALQSGIGLLAMRRRADGEPIGYCGLIIGRYDLDEPELACEVLARHQRVGYATEAAVAVVDAAFATGRKRIWATVGTWNTPSLTVVHAIGFRHHHRALDGRRGDVDHFVLEAASTG